MHFAHSRHPNHPGRRAMTGPVSFVNLAVSCWFVVTGHVIAGQEQDFRDFEQHIRPLLIEHCYECHSEDSGNRNGGLLLDTQAGWEVGGERGAALVPGDAEGSLLFRAVRYTEPGLKMPPGGQLPESDIVRLQNWIMSGAADPRTALMPANSHQTDPSDPVAGRNHWAFRPLRKITRRHDQQTEWARQPMDEFVLARLQAAGLTPAMDTDDRTLVRRLHVQLTGIAPTPKQVDAFLTDERPDALEQLVDQLLSSRQFGERWGRHWLDLARYADSNGLDENFLFREAWRYRNWVVDAVNADVPFDRFLLEQIAGDLLPYKSIEERDRLRIATGFLVVGPKVLLGVPPARQKMEIADEHIDTIGRAVLGQTLGCARCHDHKFDPIPTADYYALAGIFTSTQVMETRFMLGQQRLMERLVGLHEDGHEKEDAYEKYWRERPAIAERRKKAQSALEALEKGNRAAFEELLQSDAAAIAAAAKSADATREQRIADQRAHVAGLQKTVDTTAPIPPRAMIATDADSPADERIRLAGSFDSPGEVVARGFLKVVSDGVVKVPDGQSGRQQLAAWLTDVEHGAGRLTARVMANRVWHHLIGQGIVRTVDNFGRTGDLPSHPQLLDHLAGRLIEHNWSIKALIRGVVLSRTNAMSSRHDDISWKIDPENRLLWRCNRRRLDPETLRDTMLQAADQLDLTPLDSTVSYLTDQATGVGNAVRRKTDYLNRSIYLPVIRNDLPELFDVFDFADPQMTTGRRPDTTMATQALFVLNDSMVMDTASMTAKRAMSEMQDPQQRVRRMFELILNDVPTADEQQLIGQFVNDAIAGSHDDDSELKAWALVCHSLYASSRFQILE